MINRRIEAYPSAKISHRLYTAPTKAVCILNRLVRRTCTSQKTSNSNGATVGIQQRRALDENRHHLLLSQQ